MIARTASKSAAFSGVLPVLFAAFSGLLLGGCLEDDVPSDGDAGLDLGDAGADAVEVEYTPVGVRFDPAGESFYAMPWPSDARLTADGFVDLSDFPAGSATLFRDYVKAIQTTVQGYSLMPVFYLGLQDNPMPETAPEPFESLTAGGAVQLIDLSADGCGERTPVEVEFNVEADPYLEANVLMAAPVPGFVLTPNTTYAYVVTRTLGNEDGFSVRANAESSSAIAGTHSDAALNAHFAPLRDCLADDALALTDIAAATVFTTHDPVTELRALRDFVANEADAPVIDAFEVSVDHSRAAYDVFFGTYQTPIFQDGTSPYASSGGEIFFDEQGVPIQQTTEAVPFTVVTPSTSEPPHDLLIWVDGTGADETSWIKSDVTEELLAAGFAVASYTAQFHGERASPGSNAELHSFNVVNPQSFRNTFRQQVADTVYFVRVMTEARDQMPGLAEINDARIVYAGQSQGSLIGTMVASVEPRIEAYVLNGVAAYLALTAVERKDPIDFASLVARIASIDPGFDRFHPLMSLAQTGGDASDPHSFAPYWSGWEGNPDGVDMLLINGIDDYTAPIRGMNAVTIAGDVAPIAPAGWNVDPFDVWDRSAESLPLQDNRPTFDGGARTQAAFLSSTTGHFTIYGRSDVRAMAVNFLRTAADGQAVIAE